VLKNNSCKKSKMVSLSHDYLFIGVGTLKTQYAIANIRRRLILKGCYIGITNEERYASNI
jgi:hypothetical protein